MLLGGPPPAPGRPNWPALLLLRHRSLDVQRVQRQTARGTFDAVDLRDVRDVRSRHRELRIRHEGVARELLAGVAQVLQPEAPAAVLTAQLLALLVGELLETSVARIGEFDRPRHGHVRADTCERLEHLRLCPVESVGERGDGDDEADADAKAERGQYRAAEPSSQLSEHVGDVEHGGAVNKRFLIVG